jgi:hypothetical protein
LILGFIAGFFLGALLSHRGGELSGQENMRARAGLSIIESHRQADQMCRDYLDPAKKNDSMQVPECVPGVRELIDDQVMWDSQVAADEAIQ